ncbi:late embryogenesis abundant (LEA) hydroxyproline-rich glycoprotein family [Actinidia rufa]|uniref:Late embryogenesis abundant (LEA) hydroxyproline-rich glycoprotein family n=1 Tax=Actinidia rufa TaxID=165716 RepID=A0A7J0DDE1_9ERIC|nr:late embryogenesis abundant (LEA) hydroxyproline-rich glycoprotein family [Actinidia rufa]
MMKQQSLATELPYVSTRKVREQPILRRPHRTNPIVWCGAILCLIFSLLLIFFGVATLIVFLDIKPRIPVFDIPAASLNLIFFDSLECFNGDFTFLTNFSNPNRKIDVRLEHVEIELYFSNSLLATQALMPSTERQGKARTVSVHMISSLVYLPPNLAIELRKQVQSNRVTYNIRGTFRVRANLGLIHYSYWLHGRCQLEMSSPPTGVLLARSCRTKR